jgi:hypothetical protein
MNVSFLNSALEPEQPSPTASDDQEEMEGFNNSGYDVRYSAEIVEDIQCPDEIVNYTRPFKVLKKDKDGQSRCPLLLHVEPRLPAWRFLQDRGASLWIWTVIHFNILQFL